MVFARLQCPNKPVQSFGVDKQHSDGKAPPAPTSLEKILKKLRQSRPGLTPRLRAFHPFGTTAALVRSDTIAMAAVGS